MEQLEYYKVASLSRYKKVEKMKERKWKLGCQSRHDWDKKIKQDLEHTYRAQVSYMHPESVMEYYADKTRTS